MSIITIPLIQSHQLHEQLSLYEAQMIESAIVSMLTESSCDNEQTLKFLARLLSPTLYLDIINARIGNKICGYPLCHNSVLESCTNAFNTNSMYCSRFHSKCSLYLMRQLSQTLLYKRPGVHLTSYLNPKLGDIYSVDLLEETIRNTISTDTVHSLAAHFKRLGVRDVCNGEVQTLDDYFEQLTTEKNTCMKY